MADKICPHCLSKLDKHQSYARNEYGRIEEGTPQPGDVTICCECGEFCEFGEDAVSLLKIEDKDKLAHVKTNPDAIAAQKAVRFMKKNAGPADDYAAQIKAMAEDIRKWVATNPTKTPIQIQRNSIGNICFIATINDAIKCNVMSVNGHANDMLTDLGWLVNNNQPTVIMVEIAFGLAFKERSVD
jgi:hypothetical protein